MSSTVCLDAEVRANVTYGHYSHQIAYAASETPSRHCQVLRIRHFVRPCGFVFVFFSCLCPGCTPTSFPSKGEKKVKKRGKEKGKKKSFFFVCVCVSARAKTSLLFQLAMRRQVRGQPIGKNEKERISASRPSVQSPPALA